jgi:uncharacterized protein (TIGR03086 family)
MTIDMHPGADRLAALVRTVPDDALSRPTPCSDYTVGDLLDHISGFAVGIAAAGRKDPRGMKPPEPGRAANLGDGWRTRIAAELAELADTWDDPAAYEGMTGGPLDMPAEMAATVGVEELCIHGWDLARALGQPLEVTAAELDVVDRFFSLFGPDQRGAAYRPPVDSSATDRLARAVAESGRDPDWTP